MVYFHPIYNAVGTAFKNNSTIVKFNEYERFTNNKTIVNSAFLRCSALQQIKLPNTTTTLGYSAFQECSSLQGIELPSTLTKIEYSAFQSCTSLSVLDIPASVTTIASWIAMSCRCKIIFRSTIVPTGMPNSSEMSRTLGSGNVYVPDESVDLYKTEWSRIASKIKPLSELS